MPSPTEILAHKAMHELWSAAYNRIQQDDVTVDVSGELTVRSVETDMGASIRDVAGRLSIEAEFDTAKGSEENIRVEFPDDIRDLSESVVTIDWATGENHGSNTPPKRDFPRLARELLALF